MRIGIITDIHEDAERLSAALTGLEKMNCDMIACLGDITGYDDRFYSYGHSRDPEYCIDLINVNCRVIIPGNHDLFHLKKLPLYNTVFSFPENWYELDYKDREKISKGLLWLYGNDIPVKDIEQLREFLSSKTDSVVYDAGGIKILFSHSIAPDISGILRKKPYRKKHFRQHFDLIREKECDIGVSGHLHPNGLLKINGKKIFNPKFSKFDLNDDINHFICPCVANGMQDNGYTILDTKERTIESIPLRTPSINSIIL